MNNKTTSKKIAIFAGICFVVTLIFSIMSLLIGKMYDTTVLVTLITVTGAVFGTTCAFYYNKAKMENVYKIRKSFMREKYSILNEIGVLDSCRAQTEIEDELSKIEDSLNEEEMSANQEITYNV